MDLDLFAFFVSVSYLILYTSYFLLLKLPRAEYFFEELVLLDVGRDLVEIASEDEPYFARLAITLLRTRLRRGAECGIVAHEGKAFPARADLKNLCVAYLHLRNVAGYHFGGYVYVGAVWRDDYLHTDFIIRALYQHC